MSDVYYFGAWGEPGHHLWTPGRRSAWEVERSLPWRHLDAALVNPHPDQPEGIARLHHRDGWTALAFWDRSCDRRFGSNSAIIARGERGAAEMLALFEQHFPAVWQRITAQFRVSL
jgi:hypothetical protein